MQKTLLIAATVLIGLTISVPVHSGSFRVLPLRLFFDNDARTSILTIINNEDRPVTIQVNARKWLQDKTGEDIYEDTRDILFFPRIVTIAEHSEQVIRVGFQGQRDQEVETSYRLFLTELPVNDAPEKGARLILALQIGVPVFIKARGAAPEASLVSTTLSDGAVRVSVQNTGTAHFIVGDIRLTGMDASQSSMFETVGRGWYVLPGKTRSFAVMVPEQQCGKSKLIKTSVEAGDQKLEASVNMPGTEQCRWPARKTIKPSIASPGGHLTIPAHPVKPKPPSISPAPVDPQHDPATASTPGG
ncbi:MAG: fimbria/pilus periplasmic chaperone [Gammaproteobacteria bacterium]|nr:fimbria/pilus periplasmic chaperone [Gammaproteobacteria bacterium]